MNIEFCEENSGTSKKMHYFRKNKGGLGPAALQSGSATGVSTFHQFSVIKHARGQCCSISLVDIPDDYQVCCDNTVFVVP